MSSDIFTLSKVVVNIKSTSEIKGKHYTMCNMLLFHWGLHFKSLREEFTVLYCRDSISIFHNLHFLPLNVWNWVIAKYFEQWLQHIHSHS